uniref:Histone deacetylase 1 (Trinotate prediction) n=1 Tax=Henneguya salminicola TaxID=69463 RepID=A0A6G3MI12_HENSL
MKPHRISLTHDLVFSYSLHDKMTIFSPNKINANYLKKFHSDEYISFLEKLPISFYADKNNNINNFNVGLDWYYYRTFNSPYFDGLFDFCCSYTGASIDAARRLNTKEFDVVINWSGGFHHAKKSMVQ